MSSWDAQCPLLGGLGIPLVIKVTQQLMVRFRIAISSKKHAFPGRLLSNSTILVVSSTVNYQKSKKLIIYHTVIISCNRWLTLYLRYNPLHWTLIKFKNTNFLKGFKLRVLTTKKIYSFFVQLNKIYLNLLPNLVDYLSFYL